MADLSKWTVRRYEGKDLILYTFFRAGYYIIRITSLASYMYATRKHGVYGHGTAWNTREEKFEDPRKANAYFKGIVKRNPDIRLVSKKANAYMTRDGEIRYINVE